MCIRLRLRGKDLQLVFTRLLSAEIQETNERSSSASSENVNLEKWPSSHRSSSAESRVLGSLEFREENFFDGNDRARHGR